VIAHRDVESAGHWSRGVYPQSRPIALLYVLVSDAARSDRGMCR
jgi:hypothetical protein